jgi:hypothetical protein
MLSSVRTADAPNSWTWPYRAIPPSRLLVTLLLIVIVMAPAVVVMTRYSVICNILSHTSNQCHGIAQFMSSGPPAVQGSSLVADHARYVGSWVNADKATGGLTRLEIVRHRFFGLALYMVHAWGACHPTPCTWGRAIAAPTARGLEVRWAQGFAVRAMTIALQENSALAAAMLTHFIDASDRSDYLATDFFLRSP